MTTLEAVQIGIPRWLLLAMPEDVEQVVALADAEYQTPDQRRAARDYYLRELRRTQWDRAPRRPARRPASLRPSKRATGYRTDSVAHQTTRLRMEPQRRAEIARRGAEARWRDENSSRP
jgi:hypothetical protein